jgi:hypothetical protein
MALTSAVILRSEPRRTRDHILLSQIRDSPNLEGQVPVFISPRNRVAWLYSQALGSLFFASYDSQGYGGGLVLYSRGTDNAENTSHVIVKHCCDVTSLRLRGNVFTEPLPRSGLQNPVVPLLVRVLLRNDCFCGPTFLAWG